MPRLSWKNHFKAGDAMKRGTIVSVVAGYYFVEAEDDNKIYLCRGRGKLRKKASPLAGDQVYFSAEEEVGSVEEVLPRHNQLRRPAVANVDVVAVVLAAHSPQPNFLLVDKILALAMAQGMDALICVRSEEHTSELQSRPHLVCRLLLEKKKKKKKINKSEQEMIRYVYNN